MTDIKKYTMDDVLINLHKGAWWRYTDWNNRTYANLRVSEGFDYTLPTEEELNAQVTQLQVDYDSKDYARKRETEYPSLKDCIHALLDGGDTLTNLQSLRQSIKTKYPKESE